MEVIKSEQTPSRDTAESNQSASITSSTASLSDIIKLDVGGRIFTTRTSTLTEQSRFFAALFSDRWANSTPLIDGNVFVDASPDLFEHILNYLRRSVPPIFWTRTEGFDYTLYAALLEEARFFGIDALEKWIKDRKYLSSIKIKHSIDLIPLQHLYSGSYQRWGDVEQHICDNEFIAKNNEKKKQLITRETTSQPPVSRFRLHKAILIVAARICYKALCGASILNNNAQPPLEDASIG